MMSYKEAEDKVPIVDDSSIKAKDAALDVEKAEKEKKTSRCVDFWLDVIGLLCIAAIMFLFAFVTYRADKRINSLNTRVHNLENSVNTRINDLQKDINELQSAQRLNEAGRALPVYFARDILQEIFEKAKTLDDAGILTEEDQINLNLLKDLYLIKPAIGYICGWSYKYKLEEMMEKEAIPDISSVVKECLEGGRFRYVN